ncbi:MAG: GNAT family N-acetyltransferase [Oceanospirillales bacterium]|uniref:Acetyltransferase (GNAT) family protein n=1 Tax=Marinobacterium halophilum TaxID=267374 RepID=A0A2P8EQI3_9GAMM|nr:GNAT family N-acetyltransferase [Marinobacterium halophilum]MBR9829748.1 GNAT family N-acetyltransferase [Oceanospirillales bacterium]PSL11704.1 acetyltransferase (GNAT) family protein [Marinobacterium halophilum]
MEYSLKKANIDNLTGLWQLMGRTEWFDGLVQSVSWPYRTWLEWGQEKQYVDQHLLNRITPGYLFPVWDADADTAELESSLLANGFEMGLQQLAMVLPLKAETADTRTDTLNVCVLQNSAEVERWSLLCGQAFGYQVDAAVIEQVRQQTDVEVFWAVREGEPIATAIMYQTGNVAGVHQVGVPPEHQGQGVARALMQQLVARAQARGVKHLCLQASVAGEPLYRSLGFLPQFSIRSYRRR